MGANVKISGLNELQRGLKERVTLDDVKRVVRHNGAQLNQKAQRNSPYRTGTLMGSVTGPKILDGGLTARVEATAEYAPYVEFGTRFMTPRPFMRASLSEQMPKFVSDLNKLMK